MSTSMAPHVVSGDEIADDVVRRVVTATLRRAHLDEVVHETIYDEHARLTHHPSAPRAEEDRAFVAHLRHELAHAGVDQRSALVHEIVDRHAREISGHFDRRVYAFATHLIPQALGLLLHGAVEERVVLEGEVEALKALARVGTVVLAPTHVSNLDSVLLGYAIDHLGLPPFAYGAGLNLFTNAVIGFFMRNLGAYTVDRNKTDPLYKATLREYATVALERGQHMLFFPGGTRSRSGAVESHLKKGLLGTTTVAYRHRAEARGPQRSIFVVPCTLTYPLVLEASSLVEDWLRAEGGPHFIDVSDEFDKPRRWIDFLEGLMQLDLRVHVRFGRALDPVGNAVDADGTSRDARGRPVDVARYFSVGGRLVADEARDAEYTRALATRLACAYKADTVALPTSVVAWAVFAKLRAQHRQHDVFRLLRAMSPDEAGVVEAEVLPAVKDVVASLDGKVTLAPELRDPQLAVDVALATFRRYHPVPVIERRAARLFVRDPNLLFYYRNRLEGIAS